MPTNSYNLRPNRKCIHYREYVYFDEAGQHHSDYCGQIFNIIQEKITCATLRKNGRCPRPRTKLPLKHHHSGVQANIDKKHGNWRWTHERP